MNYQHVAYYRIQHETRTPMIAATTNPITGLPTRTFITTLLDLSVDDGTGAIGLMVDDGTR